MLEAVAHVGCCPRPAFGVAVGLRDAVRDAYDKEKKAKKAEEKAKKAKAGQTKSVQKAARVLRRRVPNPQETSWRVIPVRMIPGGSLHSGTKSFFTVRLTLLVRC